MNDLPEKIVFDTNVCSELRILFDHIIETYHTKEGKALTYEKIWTWFNGPNSVDDAFKPYLTDKERLKFKDGITTTKRILDLKANRPEIELDIPVFVFNEVAMGKSSKIVKHQSDDVPDIVHDLLYTVSYQELLESIPLRKTINLNVLKEGADFPTKSKTPMSENDLKQALKTFLTENVGVNANLLNLYEHLKDAKDIETVQKNLNKLKDASDDLNAKTELWDKKMKKFLANSNIKDYASETELLNSITGKVKEFGKNPVKSINFNEPIDVIAKRLTQSKEEFDFFDLQLYMYAKEQKAYILSFNTQAYQEINDPVFLDFFRDSKVLHPYVNFKETVDLEKSFDCIDIFKSAIERDLERDKQFVKDLNEIKNTRNSVLDKAKVEEVFDKTTNSIKDKAKETGKLRKTLEEKPFFDALNVFKMDGSTMKIDQQLAFSSDKAKIIDQQVNTLNYINEEFYNSELEPSHFEKGTPTGTNVGNLLRDKTLGGLIQDGLNDKDKNLREFLQLMKDPKKLADAKFRYKALYVESNFEEDKLKLAVSNLQVDPKKISLTSCPPKSRRRKRETSKCLLSWENIDKINDEQTYRRDPKKVQVDSEKFINYINSVEDPAVKKQLIEFVDQLTDPKNHYDGKILGDSKNDVNKLINHEKLLEHFSKVGQVSGALNSGVFAKNILADLLSDNLEGVAVNVGFLAGDQILAKVARIAELRGAALAESGKLILGNSFKVASPFIRRLGSALIVYDLVEQVKALEKGDKDAVVSIVGDGIMLGADAVEIGVGILEAAGVVAGVSGPLAPIVLTIGAVVFIGTDVYFAVKHVKALDDVLHLTTEEKISEGLNSIFHTPSQYLEELKEIKEANNMLAKSAIEFLKKQNNIQRFVFPSAFLNPETNKIEMAGSVRIQPETISNIRWARSRPDDPTGGKVFCAPQGDDGSSRAPDGTTHICIDAMGIIDLDKKEHDNVLFNLSNAYANVAGFPTISNVFLLGNGFKNMTGGQKDDIFSLRGDAENTRAVIDGLEGDNTLDVSEVNLSGPLRLKFELGRFESPFYTEFRNINKFIGRKQLKDILQPDCNTKYINAQGGLSLRSDEIIIEPRLDCRYQLTMQLNTYTVIRNSALLGDFSYIVDKGQDKITILAEIPRNGYKGLNAERLKRVLNTTHTFFINYALMDLRDTEIVDSIKDNFFKVKLEFYNDKTKTQIPIFFSLNTKNVLVGLNDNTQIKVHNYGLYAIHRTNMTAKEIISSISPIAAQFKMTVLALSESENVSVIAAGDDKHNIFSNDPQHESIIIAHGGNSNNVYIINIEDKNSVHNVTIYSQNEPNTINTLDLRPAVNQFIKSDGRSPLLLHSIDSNSKIIEINLIDSESFETLIRVTVGNFTDRCENLHVIINNAPVVLNCDTAHHQTNVNHIEVLRNYNASEHYTPVPLTFNETEVIVITENDVEKYTEIVVEKSFGKYQWIQFEDSLLMTNIIHEINSTDRITIENSILLKDFYKNTVFFLTLKFKFNDFNILLNDEQENIENAIDFDEWFGKTNGNFFVNEMNSIPRY